MQWAEGLDDPQGLAAQALMSSFGVQRGFFEASASTQKKRVATLLSFLAGAEGLEPTTHGFGDQYSTN